MVNKAGKRVLNLYVYSRFRNEGLNQLDIIGDQGLSYLSTEERARAVINARETGEQGMLSGCGLHGGERRGRGGGGAVGE